MIAGLLLAIHSPFVFPITKQLPGLEPIMATKPRPRKPISAARIELALWFASEAIYQLFSSIPLGRKATSVTDREWVSAYVFDDGHIEAVFRFTHTCRNDGAQRGDSERFFRGVCNAAGISDGTARLDDVRLISRERFHDQTPESAQVVADPEPPVGLDPEAFDPWSWADPETRLRVEMDYYLYGVAAR